MAITVTVSSAHAYGTGEGMPATPHGQDVDLAAFHTVRNYPHGVDRLGRDMGISRNTLLHKTNPDTATHHLSIREAVRLQRATGDVSILRAMAAELGYTVSPAEPDQSGGDPVEAFMGYEKAHADLVGAVADSVLAGQGGVSPNAMRRVDLMAQAASAACSHLVAMLRGRMRAVPGAGR